jgi:hypothetical protein
MAILPAHLQDRFCKSDTLSRRSFEKAEAVPQRLKPHCQSSTCGTAEAVPLSKTGYFNELVEDFDLVRCDEAGAQSHQCQVRAMDGAPELVATLKCKSRFPSGMTNKNRTGLGGVRNVGHNILDTQGD